MTCTHTNTYFNGVGMRICEDCRCEVESDYCEHEFVMGFCTKCDVKREDIPKVPSDTRESIPSAPTLDGWPVIQQGYLVIDDYCEDGHWSGYASSRGGGNIVWDTEALPITVHARTKGVNLIADSESGEEWTRLKKPAVSLPDVIEPESRIAELEKECERLNEDFDSYKRNWETKSVTHLQASLAKATAALKQIAEMPCDMFEHKLARDTLAELNSPHKNNPNSEHLLNLPSNGDEA